MESNRDRVFLQTENVACSECYPSASVLFESVCRKCHSVSYFKKTKILRGCDIHSQYKQFDSDFYNIQIKPLAEFWKLKLLQNVMTAAKFE